MRILRTCFGTQRTVQETAAPPELDERPAPALLAAQPDHRPPYHPPQPLASDPSPQVGWHRHRHKNIYLFGPRARCVLVHQQRLHERRNARLGCCACALQAGHQTSRVPSAPHHSAESALRQFTATLAGCTGCAADYLQGLLAALDVYFPDAITEIRCAPFAYRSSGPAASCPAFMPVTRSEPSRLQPLRSAIAPLHPIGIVLFPMIHAVKGALAGHARTYGRLREVRQPQRMATRLILHHRGRQMLPGPGPIACALKPAGAYGQQGT